MAHYKVKLFDIGRWNGEEPLSVEADSAEAAAERVTGVPLLSRGTPARLRAQVWRNDAPEERTMLYSPLD